MSNRFFDRPILNSPYEYPSRHWELDECGQPTSHILDRHRRVSFIAPIPKPNYQTRIFGSQEGEDHERQSTARSGVGPAPG